MCGFLFNPHNLRAAPLRVAHCTLRQLAGLAGLLDQFAEPTLGALPDLGRMRDPRNGYSARDAGQFLRGRFNSVRQFAGSGVNCGPTGYSSHRLPACSCPFALIHLSNSPQADGSPS
jgi:hypothetical protein